MFGHRGEKFVLATRSQHWLGVCVTLYLCITYVAGVCYENNFKGKLEIICDKRIEEHDIRPFGEPILISGPHPHSLRELQLKPAGANATSASKSSDLQEDATNPKKAQRLVKKWQWKWVNSVRSKTKAVIGAPRYIANRYHQKVGEFLGLKGWKKAKPVKHVHHGWTKPKPKGWSSPIIWVSGKGHDNHGWGGDSYEQSGWSKGKGPIDHGWYSQNQYVYEPTNIIESDGWSSENDYRRKMGVKLIGIDRVGRQIVKGVHPQVIFRGYPNQKMYKENHMRSVYGPKSAKLEFGKNKI